MNPLFKVDDWKIVEEGFSPNNNRNAESIFSIGNGKLGQRANFEERYSGDSLQGSYVAGVYYPDKTRVGWWKNGYPEYFAKVLNSANWIGIFVTVNDQVLDLAECKVISFRRELDMKVGLLTRQFVAETPKGEQVEVNARRYLSLVRTHTGAIHYSIKALNFNGDICLSPYIDLDVKNEDANYDEKFWIEVEKEVQKGEAYITGKTKKLDFHVCTGMKYTIQKKGKPCLDSVRTIEEVKYVGNECECRVEEGDTLEIFKYAVNLSTLDYNPDEQTGKARQFLSEAFDTGFEELLREHMAAWEAKWDESDIVIEGDPAAQQAIRFNIFHLNQTYTGEDERLNIGPKGFTGEKYGGSTYWDTEAYALPFYLATAHPSIARNLLLYRYKHLEKAIENAEKLGFKDGAALYPMVTMNGEECHNEWEITFEEIHRNGAIAYAIFNYIRHTGDTSYLAEAGVEVLIAISRFWAQRVNFSPEKQKYVMLGVTGPNEYENNVNNNWYTNTIATWTLEYTIESLNKVKQENHEEYQGLVERLKFEENTEIGHWTDIIDNMYYPVSEEHGVFLQQDGFLDKDPMEVGDLDPAQRPLNQYWSWDRILRSRFIKQADVLQGLYFLEHRYDVETIRRNFDFYERWNVHESSLSRCVHSILAARIGDIGKAYDMYLRTARLDLDDYNKEVAEGLHITSMAGTWLAIVEGFGGMRITNGAIQLDPLLPEQWDSYSFHVRIMDKLMFVKVDSKKVEIENQSDDDLEVSVFGKSYTAESKKTTVIIKTK
ncbi:family 65 glycosyl hydrolase domain-containing protein [Bacteroidota bacterium]